jgi:dCMP deaminase
MKEKFIRAYMDTAKRFAELSPAQRRKVGAIVVKNDRIISIGYNGMPVGWDNECEHKEYMNAAKAGFLTDEQKIEQFPFEEYVADVQAMRRYRLVTKDEVLHAESNAIAKLAKSNDSGESGDMFVTTAPCIHCAKLIHQSGIKRVWFNDNYRDDAGIVFLKKSGIEVNQIERDS